MSKHFAPPIARFAFPCALHPAVLALAALTSLGAAGQAPAQAPIVQPGLPGEPSRLITPDEATDLAGLRVTAADVKFMQGMITHHAQALDMTVLVADRTQRDAIRLLAQRIELSQEDEIAMMRDWLSERDLEVPEPDAHHDHDAELMPGMATPEQMEELAAVDGALFDTLFLELMIEHHEGAVEMVDDLLEQPGSAQDSILYNFTNDINSDQTAEIDRMDSMLAGFSPDPRVDLAAGFNDAGQVSLNMQLLVSLPKPAGFFDPEYPEGRPRFERPNRRGGDRPGPDAPAAPQAGESVEAAQAEDTRAAAEADSYAADAEAVLELADGDADDDGASDADAAAENESLAETSDDTDEKDEDGGPRPSLLNFGNTDLVFAGNVVVAGNYHGFNAYDISNPRSPELLSSVVCPGGQGDVSIVGDLLILSVEQTRGRLDCGLQGVAEVFSDERFRGIRIFDVSDYGLPVQVGAVQTCRGSHTHTVVTDPDDEGNIYVYGSGTNRVRPEEEMENCTDDSPFENPETALFRIDVIRIPVANPGDAEIVNRPYVFSDPESGVIAGLWEGGDHGDGTQQTSETNACHDITAYPEIGLAAGACSGNGILLDISDPVNPARVDEVIDTGFAYWHSATFNNDGSKVIFTDEWGGGGRPRCRASDPRNWGADAIYDIVDGEMQFRSYFKLPAPQTDQENCVAHNGSLVPVPGRDIFVQAWYQGGITVIDFTDSSNPVEIAFFDRGPINAESLIQGGYWSAYWYGGHVYGTEIARGFDVFALTPSRYLTENEIAAASFRAPDAISNPQQQRRHVWPAEPVVAEAYVDQLARSGIIVEAQEDALRETLERAAEVLEGDSQASATTAGELRSLATTLAPGSDDLSETARGRLAALARTMEDISGRLD